MENLPDVTHGADNIVVPFQVEGLDVRGRLIRMGSEFNALARRHNYPPEVTKLLGEVVAFGLLMASALKFDGKLIVQVQTDGPVRLLVADIQTPNRLRALARFDAERLQAAKESGKLDTASLIGQGQLVMTIDQGAAMQRYQGVVALGGQSIAEAADEYFAQSEQIPTRVKLAVGTEITPGGEENWRLGGILVQYLPEAGRGDAHDANAEPWVEARVLVDTVEAVELLDPLLSPERLLFRLFHERGVRVFEPLAVSEQCTCNRARIEAMIRSFPKEDREHMVENGKIRVTCDYCSTQYDFDPAEVE